MKHQLLFALALCCSLYCFAGDYIIVGQAPPVPRVGEESIMSSSTLKRSLSIKTTSSTVYYPVSAYVDEVALTVTFTEPVGMASVMVYDANDQLVDMVTVDTNSEYQAVLSTATWSTGNYKLVVTYGSTTLQGNFNF